MDEVTHGVGAGVSPPSMHLPAPEQLIIDDSNGEDHSEAKAPKKRAETWVHEEIKLLIALRSEIDTLFNTSKSNKHLWDQISMKMREQGFDRSPAMCTDKWRNLLKDHKKSKYHDRVGSAKMSCYKDLEELLRRRSGKVATSCRSPEKLEPYIQYSPKGLCKTAPNLESKLDREGHSLSLASDDTIAENGIQPWGWRDSMANSEDEQLPHEDNVISVKFGDTIRKIGIDGTFKAIKEAIKCSFGLRTNQAFWLEDQYGIVRTLDNKMPIGSYTLHSDEGLAIKICLHDEGGCLTDATEEKTFHSENDFYEFLRRRQWVGLRDINGIVDFDSIEELHPMHVYQRSLLRLG
eukprot:c9942_g1_i1 orf=114-1160(+)